MATQQDNLSCQKNQILILFLISFPPDGYIIPLRKDMMKKVAESNKSKRDKYGCGDDTKMRTSKG